VERMADSGNDLGYIMLPAMLRLNKHMWLMCCLFFNIYPILYFDYFTKAAYQLWYAYRSLRNHAACIFFPFLVYLFTERIRVHNYNMTSVLIIQDHSLIVLSQNLMYFPRDRIKIFRLTRIVLMWRIG